MRTLITTPPLVTCLLLVVAMTTSTIAICTHACLRNLLFQRCRILIALILLAACLRYPFATQFYHGMEYEDCFVHQAVARQLLDPSNPINHEPTYRQCISSFGSLSDGDEHQSFYHLIGYPTAIRIVQVLLGDTPAAAHWVSLLASLANIVLVFCLAAQSDRGGAMPVAAATIYVCLPLSIAFSATTSAEVFSSIWLTLSLVLLGICASPSPHRLVLALSYVALGSSIAIAVLVKRENLLVIALLPIMFLLTDPAKESAIWSRIWRSAWNSAQAMWLPVVFVCFIFVDLSSVFRDERNVVGPNAFSFANLVALGPAFASALANPRFYFLFGLLLMLLPLVWWRAKGARPVILCFMAYFGMYAAHWRSYYFLQSRTVSPWDTVRYMLNLLPLLSILSACGLTTALLWVPARWRRLVGLRVATYSLVVIVLVISARIGLAMRSELTLSEQEVRVQPMKQVVEFFQARDLKDAWLLSFEPCLLQAYGPRWLRTIDLAIIDRLDPTKLRQVLRSTDVYAFLRPWDTDDMNRERMPAQMSWLESQKWSLVSEAPTGRLLKRSGPAS